MKRAIWLTLPLFLALPAATAQEIGSVYATNCAHCHGTDGRGSTPLGRTLKLPDLRSSQIQAIATTELAAIISRGTAQGKMPGFQKKLGADMVRQLAVYVHNLDHQPEPHPKALRRAPEAASSNRSPHAITVVEVTIPS